MSVRLIQISVISLWVGSCSTVPTNIYGYIEGNVYFGPEAAAFVKCGSDEDWWIARETYMISDWAEVEKVLDAQPVCSLESIPCTHQSAFVSGDAFVSVIGKYGHLGEYPRSIQFRDISQVQKKDSCS